MRKFLLVPGRGKENETFSILTFYKISSQIKIELDFEEVKRAYLSSLFSLKKLSQGYLRDELQTK